MEDMAGLGTSELEGSVCASALEPGVGAVQSGSSQPLSAGRLETKARGARSQGLSGGREQASQLHRVVRKGALTTKHPRSPYTASP